jgi:hypothetical protein
VKKQQKPADLEPPTGGHLTPWARSGSRPASPKAQQVTRADRDRRDGEVRRSDLVLGVELLLELGDLPLFGGGEVLGVVPAHLAPASLPANARRSPPPAAEPGGRGVGGRSIWRAVAVGDLRAR